MDQAEVLQEFRDAGALLEGHFILTSGRRSAAYMQCARVLMDARRAERLCGALAAKVRAEVGDSISLVFSPPLQKLHRVRPRTLGQASRINGVTPAAISALMVTMRG